MDIQQRELKNGLVVATEVMPHLHSVSIGVWVKCGSRHECPADAGVSHFIEHLLFKGTRARSAASIAKAIDSVGGQLNAFTDKEYVCFYAKVLSRHLRFVFGLLSDIALHPSFPPEEMEREREVIFEEISMVEDSPQELIQDIHLEGIWQDHPLGRPIAGTRQSVAGISREQVCRFFESNYTARNTLITIAGNIRHEEAHALAARHFGGLIPGEAADPGPVPGFHPSRVVRPKPNLEQVHLCLGAKCHPVTSEERYASQLLCNILGGGVSSRLFQSIREKRGLAYSIYSVLNLFHDAGNLMVCAAAAPDKSRLVIRLIMKEIRKVCRELVPSRELKRAKENVVGILLLSQESSSSRMTQLAQQQLYFGRFYSTEEIVGAFDRVRQEDIRRLAREMFAEGPLALTLLGDRDGRELGSIRLEV